MSEHDVTVTVTYPSFTAWGKEWDAGGDPESPLGTRETDF